MVNQAIKHIDTRTNGAWRDHSVNLVPGNIQRSKVASKILCKPPTSGKIEITDNGGFVLWQEKIIAN